MSEFERTLQKVTEIKVDAHGLEVRWIDKNNHIYKWQVYDFFEKGFSIVGIKHKNKPAEITIKFED